MGDFFEQKKNNQRQFRQGIDKFLKECPLSVAQNQLDPSMLLTLMSGPRGDLVQNGKICMDKLYEIMKSQEHGYSLNLNDFHSIFGTQKQMKATDLAAILRKFDLGSFDLKEELMGRCFDNGKLKQEKLNKLMRDLGYSELNQKNKEILLDCFDFGNNGVIDESDIDCFLHMISEEKK